MPTKIFAVYSYKVSECNVGGVIQIAPKTLRSLFFDEWDAVEAAQKWQRKNVENVKKNNRDEPLIFMVQSENVWCYREEPS